MDEQQFKQRTKRLALDVIAFTEARPRDRATEIVARQLIRSATSVGANYRASCRGRSIQEIVAKLSLVEEEADETSYWLELLIDSQRCDPGRARPILQEANEIVAMTVASKRTLKARAGTRGFAIGPRRTPESGIVNRES